MMRKSQLLQSSNWISDLNKSKIESEDRNAFVKTKKKKRSQQNDSNSRSFAINSCDSRMKDNDTDNSSENIIPMNTPNVAKDVERPVKIRDKKKVKKFDNTGSTDLEEFASKSMDVVVDIHHEYKEEKCPTENVEENESLNERIFNVQSKDAVNYKTVIKRKTFRTKRTEKLNLSKNGSSEKHNDDIEMADSFNLIEEFQESSTNNRHEDKFETVTKGRSLKKDDHRSFVEEKPRSRRQWDASKNQTEEPKKPPRKRWTKDANIIRLPETKSISWTISSPENASLLIKDSEQPVPAARSSLKQKSFLGFDNAAFVSDNEEILRIETDCNREDTRIEIKEIRNDSEKPERPPLHSESSGDSSSERKISEETVIAIEHSTKSKTVPAIQNMKKRYRTSNVKNDKDYDRDDLSSQNNGHSKNESDDTNTSESLNEVTRRSKYESSEERAIKSDPLRIDKNMKRNRKKHFISSQSHSNQHIMSTSDEDDLDEDPSARMSDGDKLNDSDASRKKSKGAEGQHRLKTEKEKRKSVRKSISSSSTHTSHPLSGEQSKKRKKKKKKSVKYISITIHRADMLEIDFVTKHPMVKVYIVNAETGKLLKNEFGTSTYLQPKITGKFDFKENKSVIPVWEEELVFEHDFDALLKTNNEQVVIFFEIIDLLSFTEASFKYDKFGHEGCWYKIAWAFLKPVGKNNSLHINKKVRLQLYKPQKCWKRFERLQTYDVYTWWKSNNREKYSSSIFVTVTSIDPPKLEPVFYQQLSLHDLSDARSESQKASTQTLDSINFPKWTRLAAQSCKIPNENIFETDVSENGCFFVAFSNDGKYLACSFSEEHDYPIIVYKFETKKVHVRLDGHKTFVYSLHWSNNDNYLLSVSSDQTARIWDVQNQIMQHVEMMPHPSYVYCGKFDSESASIVATGCYDRVARIWARHRKSKSHELSQELEGHEGYVNSMCFQKNSNLLTADSIGVIIVWAVKETRGVHSRKEWHISRKIKVREVDGIIINTIILHPLESRLLVHSRNSGLRMLDLTTGVVLQKYNGLNNQRIQLSACISPCGGLILCGNEDSSLCVWNLETGRLLAKYTFNRNFRAVTCVDYHPYDHVLAFSTFGSPAPVRVSRFNKDATGEDVGLKIMHESAAKMNNSDSSMKCLNTPGILRERSQSNNTTETFEESSRDKSLQSSRSYKSNFPESLENILSGEENKYDNAKVKLRRLNETEKTLKSRSANRLYDIIERIDRILSNTSRSSGDVESGKNFALVQEGTKSNVSTSQNERKAKSKRVASSARTNTENHLNSYEFESSTTSSTKHEMLEMETLRNKSAKERSKSAREARDKFEDDTAKTFSDSVLNCQKTRVYDKAGKSRAKESIKSSYPVRMEANNSKPTTSRKSNRFNADYSSSSDSAGTYVVEKNNGDRNSNESSMLIFRKDDSNRSHVENNVVILSDSESSIVSNATFTIENEVPKPKPRRKTNFA